MTARLLPVAANLKRWHYDPEYHSFVYNLGQWLTSLVPKHLREITR